MNTRFKNNKILIIGYYPPESESVGAKRIKNFFLYLKEYGVAPFFVTRRTKKQQKDSGNIFYTFAPDISKLINFINGIFSKISGFLKIRYERNIIEDLFVPDINIFWIPFCLRKSLRLIRENKLFAIFVTCEPFSLALTGYFLKKITKLPLILDFRDVWSFNPYKERSKLFTKAVQWLEKLILKETDCLILNTTAAEKKYKEYYPNVKTKRIYSGISYDFAEVMKRENKTIPIKDDILKIGYFGIFYGDRDPSLLFSALKKLYEAKEIDFNFIMPVIKGSYQEKYIKNICQKYKISNKCKFPEYKNETQEIIKSMERVHLLYLKQGFSYNKEQQCIAVAAKTFEYLATGIPILVEAPQGEQVKLVQKYSNNSFYVTSDDLHIMEETIKTIYQKLTKGRLIRNVDQKLYRDFNYFKLTGELVKAFNEII